MKPAIPSRSSRQTTPRTKCCPRLYPFGLLLVALVASALFGTSLRASPRDKPNRASGTAAIALAQSIDREIQANLDEVGVRVSPIADDAEFLRRIYLDLHGVIPPADKVVAFTRSTDPQKRSKLIDELLEHPHYGEHMGGIWGRMLVLDREFVRPTKPLFFAWLAAEFNADRPWDELVFEVLTATGESAHKTPAVGFLGSELRTLKPELATNLIASRFLGLSIECAQCHRHPFARWTKEDYWGMANFFTRVRRTKTKGVKSRLQGLQNSVKRNRASQNAPEMAPKFLGGKTPTIDVQTDRRFVFAKWATSSENPYFARAKVNRMWAHFFGRGFVNPVDDMARDRKITHPRLLDSLTREFVRSEFDIHFLIRAICNSQTYQRTSRVAHGNEADRELYSHMYVKMLTPEQLWNCYASLGLDLSQINDPNHNGNLNLERFRSLLFNGDEVIDALEYKLGASHALFFMNELQLAAKQKDLVTRLAQTAKTSEGKIERIYLTLLNRYPSAAEKKTVEAFLKNRGAKQESEVYSDILWALLLSSEFTVNH